MRWFKPRPPDAAPTADLVRVGACTDVGQVRSENQDHLGVHPPEAPRLFIVADGMGGHEDGHEASRIAVEALVAHFSQARGALVDRLAGAVRAANHAVWQAAADKTALRRMGTTCTALALDDRRAALAHVGDSRAYRIAPGHALLDQLTPDHTVAGELLANGIVSEAEAGRHPQRHALTRALGMDAEVDVFALDLGTVAHGTRFVLCSDGLAPVPPAEVARAAAAYDPQDAAEWLVAQANAHGGPDNVTVVIVEITGRDA